MYQHNTTQRGHTMAIELAEDNDAYTQHTHNETQPHPMPYVEQGALAAVQIINDLRGGLDIAIAKVSQRTDMDARAKLYAMRHLISTEVKLRLIADDLSKKV
jgi:hypothetical protein